MPTPTASPAPIAVVTGANRGIGHVLHETVPARGVSRLEADVGNLEQAHNPGGCAGHR